jgi:hypothetical protein
VRRIGNICSLTNKLDLDPPSLDISTFNSLISTVDFGVCKVRGRFLMKKKYFNKIQIETTKKKIIYTTI